MSPSLRITFRAAMMNAMASCRELLNDDFLNLNFVFDNVDFRCQSCIHIDWNYPTDKIFPQKDFSFRFLDRLNSFGLDQDSVQLNKYPLRYIYSWDWIP